MIISEADWRASTPPNGRPFSPFCGRTLDHVRSCTLRFLLRVVRTQCSFQELPVPPIIPLRPITVPNDLEIYHLTPIILPIHSGWCSIPEVCFGRGSGGRLLKEGRKTSITPCGFILFFNLNLILQPACWFSINGTFCASDATGLIVFCIADPVIDYGRKNLIQQLFQSIDFIFLYIYFIFDLFTVLGCPPKPSGGCFD